MKTYTITKGQSIDYFCTRNGKVLNFGEKSLVPFAPVIFEKKNEIWKNKKMQNKVMAKSQNHLNDGDMGQMSYKLLSTK